MTTILDNPRVGARFPAVLYLATADNRTRPQHADWDGRIIGVDTPDYTTAKAMQAEYNCRCQLIPLTERRAKSMGWTGGSTPITPQPGPVVKPEPAPAPPKPIVLTTEPRKDIAPPVTTAPAASKPIDMKKVAADPNHAIDTLRDQFGVGFSASSNARATKILPHMAKVVGALESLHQITGIDRHKLSVKVGGKPLEFFVDHDKARSRRVQAYYQPSRNRLAVHETRGAGAIAHEWAHALDYSAVGDGEKAATSITHSQKFRLPPKQKRVVEAIESVLDKLAKTDYYKRLDKSANEINRTNPGYATYVTSRVEVFARVAESYLLTKSSKDKYLNKDKRKAFGRHGDSIYPTPDELDTLHDEFAELFAARQEME